MAETFNSEGVKAKMSELETHFQKFAETLKDINTTVNELVNNGPDSAIFGEVGSSLLNTWNYNSSTFGDFHANFQNWTEVVSVIAANNAQFVVAAESIYRSNGANLEGVQDKRAAYAADPTASEYYQNAINKENDGGNCPWTSYEDAVAAGIYNIRTPHEFSRGGDDKEKYGTYQNYLNAMYEKYVTNGLEAAEIFIGAYGLDATSNEWISAYEALSQEAKDIVDKAQAEQGENTGGSEEPPANEPESGSGSNSSAPIKVVSGQEVVLNGEKCYFLMRDSQGNNYYVKSTDANAQVFVADENGNLSPYLNYTNNKIVSRESFVNDRKYNMDYYWNIEYNNGVTPYDDVGSTVDSSFTANVSNPSQGMVTYSQDYLQNNATTLDAFDRGTYGLDGNTPMPEVLYIAPGQSIKYDKPWDTYDNKISGGSNGTYLVYDSSSDAYYVIKDGSYYSTRSNGTFGAWISREQLLNERTTITK